MMIHEFKPVSISFLNFWVNAGKWRQERHMCLDISFLFLHRVPKLVQTPVITNVDISQALALEGDVMPLKPFLDLGIDGVVRSKSPASDFHVFGKLKKHFGGRRFPTDDTVESEVQKWLQGQNVSLYRQSLGNLIIRYDKCLKYLETGKIED
jgi:hypothetical protein